MGSTIYSPSYEDLLKLDSNHFGLGSEIIKSYQVMPSEVVNTYNAMHPALLELIGSARLEDTLNTCNHYLPLKGTYGLEIMLLPSMGDTLHMTNQLGGVWGYTISSNLILLLVNCHHEGAASLLPYVLAHEYHHGVWMSVSLRHRFFDLTVLEVLIFEGMADYFALLCNPDKKGDIPWLSGMAMDKERATWNIIQGALDSKHPQIINLVRYGNGVDVPYWAGYWIGYGIIETYMQKPNARPVSEWFEMAATEFLPWRLL